MQATEAAVRAVPTPAPVGRWHPIGHARLIDEVNGAVEDFGLEVTKRRYDLAAGGGQVFGTYHIGGSFRYSVPGTLRFMLGFRGSIDQSLAEALVFGTEIVVCSNGMFAGERVIRRKNTRNILSDIGGLIREGLSAFGAFRDVQSKQYVRLAETRLSDKDAHHFICRAILKDNGVLPPRDVVKVLREWDEPLHEEFGPKTAWRLHNAFTEVAKPSVNRNPVVASRRLITLDGLFRNEFASDLPTLEDVAPQNN